MNKELKEQAHKEFDEKFDNEEFPFQDQACLPNIHDFIDSLIDKTVQMTEERIYQDLNNAVKHFDNIEMKTFLYTDQIKTIITNKNDINK